MRPKLTNDSIQLPDLPYRPRDPQRYRPQIGLIGCGAIAEDHLRAYAAADYDVVALCDVAVEAAEKRRDEFYPAAKVFSNHRDLLAIDAIEVVDVTTHPEVRAPLVEDALRARKHVLSQKPYVLDLDVGRRLADLADEQHVLLAVNQNGRWAPHFSYLREAVRAGLVGDVHGVHCGVHWDHTWVRGTQFENVYHLILYDFAIHWFDFLTTIMHPQQATRVFASAARTARQDIMPPLLGQVLVEYPHAQATLVFDADVNQASWDRVLISGTKGIARSSGTGLKTQQVEISNKQGTVSPALEGTWFPDGFHGTMGELLRAIEEKRQPSHSARNNLASLEICFAAVQSSVTGQPVAPGNVRKLPVGEKARANK